METEKPETNWSRCPDKLAGWALSGGLSFQTRTTIRHGRLPALMGMRGNIDMYDGTGAPPDSLGPHAVLEALFGVLRDLAEQNLSHGGIEWDAVVVQDGSLCLLNNSASTPASEWSINRDRAAALAVVNRALWPIHKGPPRPVSDAFLKALGAAERGGDFMGVVTIAGPPDDDRAVRETVRRTVREWHRAAERDKSVVRGCLEMGPIMGPNGEVLSAEEDTGGDVVWYHGARDSDEVPSFIGAAPPPGVARTLFSCASGLNSDEVSEFTLDYCIEAGRRPHTSEDGGAAEYLRTMLRALEDLARAGWNHGRVRSTGILAGPVLADHRHAAHYTREGALIDLRDLAISFMATYPGDPREAVVRGWLWLEGAAPDFDALAASIAA